MSDSLANTACKNRLLFGNRSNDGIGDLDGNRTHFIPVRQTGLCSNRVPDHEMVPCDGFAPTSPVLQTGAFTRLAYKAYLVWDVGFEPTVL